MSEQVNKATEELTTKLNEVTDLHRVVTNGLNWLVDLDVKMVHIAPVHEFVGFLQGFQKELLKQKQQIEAQMPKKAEEPVKA